MTAEPTLPNLNHLAEECLRELEAHAVDGRQAVILRYFERLHQAEYQLRCELDAERGITMRLTEALNSLEVTTNGQQRMLVEQAEFIDGLRNLLLSAPYAVKPCQPLTSIVSNLIERAKASRDFEMMLLRVTRAVMNSERDLTDSAIARVLQQANDLVKRKGTSSPLRGPSHDV